MTYVHLVCAGAHRGQGCQCPGTRVTGTLMGAGSSARAVSALNCGAISPALYFFSQTAPEDLFREPRSPGHECLCPSLGKRFHKGFGQCHAIHHPQSYCCPQYLMSPGLGTTHKASSCGSLVCHQTRMEGFCFKIASYPYSCWERGAEIRAGKSVGWSCLLPG